MLSRKAGDLFSKTIWPRSWKIHPTMCAAMETSHAVGYLRANTLAEYVIVSRKGA
jgi:hypothetical protein